MATSEYICRTCGHQFPWFSADGPQSGCPRCGGLQLKSNPWLLLVPDAESLTDEDHYDALLSI